MKTANDFPLPGWRTVTTDQHQRLYRDGKAGAVVTIVGLAGYTTEIILPTADADAWKALRALLDARAKG